MNMLYSLSSLGSLVASVLMILAAISAMRHLRGNGAILLLIGSIGTILSSLFWVFNSLGGLVGLSFFGRFEPEKVAQVFGAISMFSTVSWLMSAVGILLLVTTMGATLRRSEVLATIQAEQR